MKKNKYIKLFSTLLLTSTLFIYSNNKVKADTNVKNNLLSQIQTISLNSGIKDKNGKIFYVSQLKENKINQLDTKLFMKNEQVKSIDNSSSTELKLIKENLEKEAEEIKSDIITTANTIQTKTIHLTVKQNELEEKEEKISKINNEIITEKLLEVNNNKIMIENKVEEKKEKELEKNIEITKTQLEIQKTENKVLETSLEKQSLEIKVTENKEKLSNIEKLKKDLEKKIEEKELEEKRLEEEQKLKELEEQKRIEEENKKIARQNQNFNENALSLAPYNTNEWVTFTEKIKDSDFEAPSKNATQIGYDNNKYALGNCTWYVYNRIAETSGKYIYPYLGDAKQWVVSGPEKGYKIIDKPESGSIVVFGPTSTNSYGHVAFVEHVYENNTFLISEMNIGTTYAMAWRILEVSDNLTFIKIP